jgi:hypothetical protein
MTRIVSLQIELFQQATTPFDDTIKLCRKLISAPHLTLGDRSGRMNTATIEVT